MSITRDAKWLINKEGHTKKNKDARTGASLTCPLCDKEFIKKAGHQVFCETKCTRAYNAVRQYQKKRGGNITSDPFGPAPAGRGIIHK